MLHVIPGRIKKIQVGILQFGVGSEMQTQGPMKGKHPRKEAVPGA